MAKISVIIRTLNEEKYLDTLLSLIKNQNIDFNEGSVNIEVVVVDSGSTDSTLIIASKHEAKIAHIDKNDFSFGRSLNLGCSSSKGEILVFISGHCLPINSYWLQELCMPLIKGDAEFVYGRQFGGPGTKFSEAQIFSKYFSSESNIPQNGYYCNNANSAIIRCVWDKYRFNESLTGLEDMEIAKRISCDGGRVGYVSEAGVFHLHNETWGQVQKRFEREALALREIMPEVHFNLIDFAHYYFTSVFCDLIALNKVGLTLKNIKEILIYRFRQYLGSYIGNHEHRVLSAQQKKKYFYPK